jgi:hypothetical protein
VSRARLRSGTATEPRCGRVDHVKNNEVDVMQGEKFFTPLRILSYIVLAGMLVALAYAAWISMTHWAGIGV